MTETAQKTIHTFQQHTRSNWLQQIDEQAEAITRNSQSVTSEMPGLMAEKPFETEVSLSAQLLERLLSTYMVIKDDLVITVAHKTVRHKSKRR